MVSPGWGAVRTPQPDRAIMDSRRLPLFPLPVVLFPENGMPLHIFEPRYREMVADIMDGDRRFGFIYHDPDESGPFLNREGQVGTVAEIRKHQPLPDGRSMLVVRGLERFVIRNEVEDDTPYYQADVEEYGDESPASPEKLVQRRERSLGLFRSMLQALPHVPDALPELRADKEVSFLLAGVVQMEPFWQQELLEMRDEVARLERLEPIFRVRLERLWEGGGTEA